MLSKHRLYEQCVATTSGCAESTGLLIWVKEVHPIWQDYHEGTVWPCVSTNPGGIKGAKETSVEY
jgi:hypothetical protein